MHSVVISSYTLRVEIVSIRKDPASYSSLLEKYLHESLSGPWDVDSITDVEGQRIEQITSIPVFFYSAVSITLLVLTLEPLPGAEAGNLFL